MTNSPDATEWGYEELRRAIDAAGVSLWCWNVDTDDFVMDARGHDLWDHASDLPLTFETLSEKVHPQDRDRVRAAFSATRAIEGSYEIDFRTIVGSNVRWVSARGQGNDAGITQGEMRGIFLDITGRKHAEEGNELLAGEMSHRVKNLLAIASGLTRITQRTSDSIEDMSRQLTQRLAALGRAHDLVRPLPGGQGKAALLGDLLAVLLAPYDHDGAFAGRVRVAVPRMGIGEAAATGLSLVVHELATNSVKYGALSADNGTLDISGTMVGDDIEIVWTEQGGPEIAAPQDLTGFGSTLVRQTMEAELGGSIKYDWSRSGVVVTMFATARQLA